MSCVQCVGVACEPDFREAVEEGGFLSRFMRAARSRAACVAGASARVAACARAAHIV